MKEGYMRLSDMSTEDLNALKDEEVRPYIQQWFDYLNKLLEHAGKGRTAMAKVFNTLDSQKQELVYVMMFCVKSEWRPHIIQLVDRLSQLEPQARKL